MLKLVVMNVIKTRLKFVFIIAACLWTADTFGCSCLHNHKVTVEDLWVNDLIFQGEVLSVRDTWDERGVPNRKALFKINKHILSELKQDTISIYTPGGSTSCGLYFSKGATWLIFANGYKSFSASSCSNSRVIRDTGTKKEIEQIITFLDSLQNGSHSVRQRIEWPWRVYDLIGKIENGKPVGKWVKISGSDTIAWLNFRNGIQYGKQRDRSNPAGALDEDDIEYVNGDKIETKRMSSVDGKMKTSMQFKNGELHGSFEMQFGSSKEIGHYMNGKEDGEWINYEAGKIVSRKIYANGLLLKSIEFDQDGDIIRK